MKALIWTLRVLLALVMLLLIFASGTLLFSAGVKQEDPPVLLGYAPFTVSSNEMTPSLYPGDLAILRIGPQCQPGDIAAFRKEGRLVLRRIVGTSEEMFITQQEAFGQPDVDLLDPALVEAVCVTYLPGCGTAAQFLYSPVGLAVLVVLAIALLIVPAFLSGGAVRPEGPQVDYGEAPAPSPAPAPRRRREPDDYDDDEEDGPPLYTAPPRREQKPAPRKGGGSHYKPRH